MNFEISTVEREILDYFYINKISENEALNFIKNFNWFNEPILKNYKEQLYIYKLQKFIEDDDIENVISLLNEKELNIDLSWSVEFAFDNIEIVKLLLEDERVDPSYDDDFLIKTASDLGLDDVVILFLKDNRINPAAGKNYPLRVAIQKNHIEIVKLLLNDKRVSPIILGNNAISVACNCKRTEIVKILLEDKRVDPSVANNYPFQISSEYEDVDTLKLLLTDNRVDPSCSNNFALKTAYRRKNTEMIQVLWKSKKVRNEIFNENIEMYNKINTLYNVDIF